MRPWTVNTSFHTPMRLDNSTLPRMRYVLQGFCHHSKYRRLPSLVIGGTSLPDLLHAWYLPNRRSRLRPTRVNKWNVKRMSDYLLSSISNESNPDAGSPATRTFHPSNHQYSFTTSLTNTVRALLIWTLVGQQTRAAQNGNMEKGWEENLRNAQPY